jgi:hypothetical protein
MNEQLLVLSGARPPILPRLAGVRAPGSRKMGKKKKTGSVRTFWCDSAPHEWQHEFGPGPDEAEIAGQL